MCAATWKQWGVDLDQNAIDQMDNACGLPVALAGALMPDAHLGYGLPIGGVLATDNAVVPYAVGVDIACRVKMSVLDIKPGDLDRAHTRDRLARAIDQETRFGVGASFQNKRDHDVMDRDWSISPVTKRFKDKAWSQLGTSGSGNHFVEFGVLTIPEGAGLGLDAGEHMALLTHSGSRGTGASVCQHYSRIAQKARPHLPKQQQHLAWLDLDSQAGAEYWQAMNLMGAYAAANHACIHHHVARNLGARVMLDWENHHNFAWKETHEIGGEQREVIVHRKGATPASEGEIGIIPGSMTRPTFIVRGKGSAASLRSASHGAGRVMSRRKAKETYRWAHVRDQLTEAHVTLMSAGIDENPNVYKDIEKVMSEQADLVQTVARFQPRLVKMAPEGERPED